MEIGEIIIRGMSMVEGRMRVQASGTKDNQLNGEGVSPVSSGYRPKVEEGRMKKY